MESENTTQETTQDTAQNTAQDIVAKGGRQMGPVAQNESGGSNSTSPAKPAEGPGGQSTEGMPSEMEQPPDMNCSEEDETCEMPTPPEGFDGTAPSEMQGGGFGGGMRGEMMQTGSTDSVLHPVGYLTLGGVSVVLATVISYACFSKCFHLKPAQTFSSGLKFLAFLGVVLAVAVGLMALGYFVPIWVRG